MRRAAARAAAACVGGSAACDGRTYSRKEVAQHKRRADCWLTIESKVYDVSGFLAQHPGGANVLAEYCGKDASGPFGALHSAGSLPQPPLQTSWSQEATDDLEVRGLLAFLGVSA